MLARLAWNDYLERSNFPEFPEFGILFSKFSRKSTSFLSLRVHRHFEEWREGFLYKKFYRERGTLRYFSEILQRTRKQKTNNSVKFDRNFVEG